ncbi:hypothetical protein L218DRAFT_145018 [Marasmius fiardii PR-910]|nr:hypothetical protein L218DRAFT_145018 [Marasmius fiardii PR-910]
MNPQVAYTTLNSTSAYMSGLPYPSATGAVALKENKDKLIKKKKREKEAKEPRVPLPVSLSPNEPSRNGSARGSGTSDAPENQQAGPSSFASVSKPSIPQSGSSLLQDTQRSSAPSIYQHLLRKPQNLTQIESSNSVASNQKPKQRSKSPKRYTSITSDARSEHYLLAARKIGRERAGIVTGLVNSKTERDQERHRQAKEEMERERQAAGFTGYYRNVSAAPTAAKKGKGKTSANSNPPKPPTTTTSPPSIIPLQYPTTPNSAANNTTSPRTPTPKRPSTGSIPGVQLFQHPGSPHGATYMFVPNPGLIGYSHPHMQTPPGALRMPIIASPLAAPPPSVASTTTKPAGQPSSATAQVPRQVGGQSGSSQSRKNQNVDDVDVTASTVADAINQSLDSSSLTASSSSSSSSSTVPQPKTPLASLLSAAQSMMEDGSGGGKSGKRKSSSQPESPTSKRRKTNSVNTSAGNVRNLGKRVRSALDVLADQAAVAGAGSASVSGSQQTDQVESSSATATVTKNNGLGIGTRRSSRSKKGKGKEALVDVPLPRIISPAGSIGRRGSTPRMIIPPDSQRSSEASVQSQSAGGSTPLLPPPVITTFNSSVASTPSAGKTSVAAAVGGRPVEKGEMSPDPGRVQDRANPPQIMDGSSDKEVDSKATALVEPALTTTTTEVSLSSSSLVSGPTVQPSAPDPEPPKPIDDIPLNSALSSSTAPETRNQPPPDQEKPVAVVKSLKDKEKRSMPTEGEVDSDADGDADPDVDVEMGSSVV